MSSAKLSVAEGSVSRGGLISRWGGLQNRTNISSDGAQMFGIEA